MAGQFFSSPHFFWIFNLKIQLQVVILPFSPVITSPCFFSSLSLSFSISQTLRDFHRLANILTKGYLNSFCLVAGDHVDTLSGS